MEAIDAEYTPIPELTDLATLRREWKGVTPEGFNFEISHHGQNEKYSPWGTWCYYITIQEEQVHPAVWKKLWLRAKGFSSYGGMPHYNYYDAPFYDVHWHCGVTYYNKHKSVDTNKRHVKIGCDYAHYWDDDRRALYNERWLFDDVLKTSRELGEMLRPKVRCGWIGQWFDPAYNMVKEMKGQGYNQQGYLSPAGLGNRSKDMRQRRNKELTKLGFEHLVVE